MHHHPSHPRAFAHASPSGWNSPFSTLLKSSSSSCVFQLKHPFLWETFLQTPHPPAGSGPISWAFHLCCFCILFAPWVQSFSHCIAIWSVFLNRQWAFFWIAVKVLPRQSSGYDSTPSSGVMGLISGWGAKTPYASLHGQKKKKNPVKKIDQFNWIVTMCQAWRKILQID